MIKPISSGTEKEARKLLPLHLHLHLLLLLCSLLRLAGGAEYATELQWEAAQPDKCGFSKDCVRTYNASSVLLHQPAEVHDHSHLPQPDFSRDGWRNKLRKQHAQARQRCQKAGDNNQIDTVTGGWCLVHKVPEEIESLPHNMSYSVARNHAAADYGVLQELRALLAEGGVAAGAAGGGAGHPDTGSSSDRSASPPQQGLHGGQDVPSRYASLIDFGAGQGQYARALLAEDPRYRVRSFDGAGNIVEFTQQLVHYVDLTMDLAFPPADWVLSLEVGEHIPHRHEEAFVRNLHRHNCKGLVLSWGKLGQEGHGHVNNHSKEYLHLLFSQLGYVLDIEATQRMTDPPNKRGLKHNWWWFRMGTIQVLRRLQPRRDCR